MVYSSTMSSANFLDNFIGWLDESLGISLKDEFVESQESYKQNHAGNVPSALDLHNKQMSIKVNEWLLNLPEEFEPLDDEDDEFYLSEEEMTIYEELMKKHNASKAEWHPLDKILSWLEDLTSNRDDEDDKNSETAVHAEHVAVLKRCESVEDFLNEKLKICSCNNKEDNDVKETVTVTPVCGNTIPLIIVPNCDEERSLNDPYLDESASTRMYNPNESDSCDDLDEDKSGSLKSSKNNWKLKVRPVTKQQFKKLGKFLRPPKTIYRQRSNSDSSIGSLGKDNVFQNLKRKEKRKDRSFSEGDVFLTKDGHPRIERAKKKLEKRKREGRNHDENGVSEDELESKPSKSTAQENLVKRRLIKLVVTQAKYTLNGY